ncbi:unnamed protein product [Peronospora belbahrii]|uniref:PB1 domain-containing protein n=1 Tax=Peronospora belbahrii TaxID=622444 RepID=A0AAU9KVN4_9STRA|nr:unnamed protein product [Peronospora belbahrii]
MSESVELQLTYAGETHCTMLALYATNDSKTDQVLNYDVVVAKVHELFPHVSSPWTLVYRDEEGDIITLTHALEFDEACRVLLLTPSPRTKENQVQSLHFYILSRVSFREKIFVPVLLKVVELAGVARDATATLRNCELLGKGCQSIVRLAEGAMTQAGVAMNHIRNSEVVGRGRESLGYSATLFFSARTGVSTRLRRASSAVAAGIERRRSSSGLSDDRDFRPPTDAIKSSSRAVSLSSPSSEVAVTIDLRQSVSSMTSETPLVQSPRDVEASGNEEGLAPARVSIDEAEQQVPETAYESDADTLCDDDDDREWDIVDNSGSTATNEENAETTSEWVSELAVLRGILVHLDEGVCCDLLSQYNGNVEAVLVELTNV